MSYRKCRDHVHNQTQSMKHTAISFPSWILSNLTISIRITTAEVISFHDVTKPNIARFSGITQSWQHLIWLIQCNGIRNPGSKKGSSSAWQLQGFQYVNVSIIPTWIPYDSIDWPFFSISKASWFFNNSAELGTCNLWTSEPPWRSKSSWRWVASAKAWVISQDARHKETRKL